MKMAKMIKTQKNEKIEMAESYSIKNMIKIIIAIVLIFVVFYFITTFVVKEDSGNLNNSVPVIDSSKITMSQILNRKESEYYVIATKASLYDSSYIETDYIEFYNNYINKYKKEEDSLTFYYVDLDDALNKKYFSKEVNITNQISELKLNDEALFKINNGEIEKSYIGKDSILEQLSKL